jgi:hypothetical protein
MRYSIWRNDASVFSMSAPLPISRIRLGCGVHLALAEFRRIVLNELCRLN